MSVSIVLIADVWAYLQFPASPSAGQLVIMQQMIDAAAEVIRMECGDVFPAEYDEYHSGGDLSVWAYHSPILSVQKVEEGWGWINYNLDFVEVNSNPAGSMFAYSLDSAEAGMITRRSAGNVAIPFIPGEDNIRVTYIAGRAVTPPVIYLAVLELVNHWWQNSQQRNIGVNGGQYDSVGDTEFTRATGLTSINQGVPYRILEMIKPYRRFPVIG